MSAETLGGASAPFGADDAARASAEGFFRVDGGTLVPAAFATSPWGPVLHGRLIGGLTARAAEQVRAADPELACCRLNRRPVPLRAARAAQGGDATGARGQAHRGTDVTIEQDERPGRSGQGRAAAPVRAAGRHVPPAARLGCQDTTGTRAAAVGRGPPLGPAPWESMARRQPDTPGGMMADGLWIRDTHPLITGEQLTPLARLAMAADLSSPVSNSSDRGLSFINADYTVYLGREPEGEYVGIQPAAHISDRGVAAGHCVLHDLRGPVGFVTTAAVANPTMGTRPANGNA